MKYKIAQSGKTADNREIKADWLRDIAQNYNIKTYAARIWIEHLRGISPSSDFRACGSVASVSIEETDGVVSLYAELEPNKYALELNGSDQKIFTSIEVNENFAGTGKAYLTGLALTDSPASLGIDVVKFSLTSGFKAAPHDGVHTFHQTGELDLSVGFDDTQDKDSNTNLIAAFTSAIKTMFKTNSKPTLDEQSIAAFAQVLGDEVKTKLDASAAFNEQKLSNLQLKFDALEAKFTTALSTEQQATNSFGAGGRPTADGGVDEYIKAQC